MLPSKLKFLTVLFVLAALVLAPAAARTVTSGGSIFVYENGLDISDLGGDNDVSNIVYRSPTGDNILYFKVMSANVPVGKTIPIDIYVNNPVSSFDFEVNVDNDKAEIIGNSHFAVNADLGTQNIGTINVKGKQSGIAQVTFTGANSIVTESTTLTIVDATRIVKSLRHYTDYPNSFDNSISVSDPTSFNLESFDVQGIYGVYYAVDQNGQLISGKHVQVKDPKITRFDILCDGETVNGQTLTRDANLQFRIESNMGELSEQVQIHITTEAGSTFTQLGTGDWSSVTLNSNSFKTGTFQLTGVNAGTYTARVYFPASSQFYGEVSSPTVSFSVGSSSLSISANKDTVVAGKVFSVTIKGSSNTVYYLKVDTAATHVPTVVAGQVGYQGTVDGYYKFKTNSAGTVTVEFDTTNADDKSYTIKVQEGAGTGKYATVKVRVIDGDITLAAEGTGRYFLGQTITLSGANTHTEQIHLYITGPNVAWDEIDSVDVDYDDMWEYDWDSADCGYDIGSYTVYATADAISSKSKLSTTVYATKTIYFNKPGLKLELRSSVAKGDTLTIRGTASGQPDSVYIWIFGKNYRNLFNAVDVEDDGTFEWDVPGTSDLTAGEYFVVLQHPMGNGIPDVYADGNYVKVVDSTRRINLGSLRASDAATALIEEIESSAVDDLYDSGKFVVEEAILRIDPIGQQTIGTPFTITGTTNVEVGNTITVEILSSSFNPTQKTQTDAFAGFTGEAKVEAGQSSGLNAWSVEVDTANFKVDEYLVTVECIETGTTTTALFTATDVPPTPEPTQVISTPITTEPTPYIPPPTPPTPEPTMPTPTETPKSPGFGALVALVGLGVVSLLILRKDE